MGVFKGEAGWPGAGGALRCFSVGASGFVPAADPCAAAGVTAIAVPRLKTHRKANRGLFMPNIFSWRPAVMQTERRYSQNEREFHAFAHRAQLIPGRIHFFSSGLDFIPRSAFSFRHESSERA